MNVTITQAKGYTGNTNAKYAKELAKLTKQFMKMGKQEKEARECAESVAVMYAHHHDYREVVR